MKRASASEEEVGGTHFRWGMDSEGRESESRWNMKSSIDISRLYFLRARSSECTVLNVETDGGIETEMESQKSMTSRKLLERHPPATREQVMQMQEAQQARLLCTPWVLSYAVSRPPHAQECWVYARHRRRRNSPAHLFAERSRAGRRVGWSSEVTYLRKWRSGMCTKHYATTP